MIVLSSTDPDHTAWHSTLPLAAEVVAQNREAILSGPRRPLIQLIEDAWMHYDRAVFGGWISRQCHSRSIEQSFSVSGRSERVGARLVTTQKRGSLVAMQFRLSPPFISSRVYPAKVYGQPCAHPDNVAIVLLEHELVHQVELLVYGNSSCKKPLFWWLARSLFAHQRNDASHAR